MLPDKAGPMSGNDPDYAIRDLYNAIAKGNCVSQDLSQHWQSICALKQNVTKIL